jgi:hypothetical protein
MRARVRLEMRTRHDQLAKAILSALLQPVAHVETGREIPGHAQVADLWIEPEPVRGRELALRGVLGRMIALGPCLLPKAPPRLIS